MKPALSVIFFTVASGAGLGLSCWLVLVRWFGLDGDAGAFWRAVACAVLLVVAGLASSTLHLANRRNAWRAMTQWRTSWLSREAVFALLFVVAGCAWMAAVATGAVMIERVAGAAVLLLAGAVVLSTAMIYACLKTIPQWRTWHTVIGYPLFALASGMVVCLVLDVARDATSTRGPWGDGDVAAPLRALAALMLAGAALVKASYYLAFPVAGAGPSARHDPARTMTLADALNLSPSRARLLDAGHSHDNFITREFGFSLARSHARWLRAVALVAGCVLPAMLLLWLGQAAGMRRLAAASCLGGLLVERWLYFAEARHVVRRLQGID